MGLWDKLFGTAKATDNLLDKDKGLLVRVGGFINDLHYSEAEKAEASKELQVAVLDYAKQSVGENSERSKARRELAIEIMRVELSLVLMSVGLYKIDSEYSQFIWEVATSALLAGAFGAVVVFFFGSYGIGQHIIKPLKGNQ